MEPLGEWCFEFDVTGTAPAPRPVIDALLGKALVWAKARALGVGGGYRPLSREVGGAAPAWRFRFGLCAQADDQLISEKEKGSGMNGADFRHNALP